MSHGRAGAILQQKQKYTQMQEATGLQTQSRKRPRDDDASDSLDKPGKKRAHTVYHDPRDASFDACNSLRKDIAALNTYAEKVALLRSRMSQCILVFAYATHPDLHFGCMNGAFDLLEEAQSLAAFHGRQPEPPPSLFLYLDLLQDDSCEIERDEAVRDLSAWLYEHPDHADWLRVILDGNKWSLYKLFAPHSTYYAIGSALRWYRSQLKP